MNAEASGFSLAIEGTRGLCPAGEAYAARQMARKAIPVLSCEGPCIRGDIARRAANLVAQKLPGHARACHAETFFVPHSAMARWVRQAERCVMIDGCFLNCHGRVLKGLVGTQRIVPIDALSLHGKYADVFLMDDVPQKDREEVAAAVAGRIVTLLEGQGQAIAAIEPGQARPCAY